MSKDFNAEEESAIVRMLQAVAVPVLGNVCHVFMNGLNRVQVCEFGWHSMFHVAPLPIFTYSIGTLLCARIDLCCYLLL